MVYNFISQILRHFLRVLSKVYPNEINSKKIITGIGSSSPVAVGGALHATDYAAAPCSPRQENNSTNQDENIQDHRTSADESNTGERTAAATGNSVSFRAGGAPRPTGVGEEGSSGPTIASGAPRPTVVWHSVLPLR